MRTRALLSIAVVFAALAAPRAARAESGRELFERALAAARSGDNATACKLFKESYRAEPAGGTLMNVAICLEEEGKLADAYNAFAEARERAMHEGKTERADSARVRLDALAPKVARVAVKNPDALGARAVWLDGAVSAPLSTRPVAVAPGTHVVELRSAAATPWSTQVDATFGTTAEIVITPVAIEARSSTPPPAPPPAPTFDEGRTQKTTAFVVGGIGVAGVAVGSVFGVLAFGKKTDAKAQHDASPGDAAAANAIADQGRTLADVSTIAFVVGGIALASGIVLFATAPSSSSQTAARIVPTVGLGSAGVRGTF